MIKKLTVIAIPLWILLQSNVLLAEDQPHIVPAPDCPIGETCCPSEIYCSYTEGCGDSSNWLVDGQGTQPFDGVKLFNLTSISASISYPKEKTYWFSCRYGSINLIDASYKLNGIWEYSGFGSTNATCNSNNPLDCTGTKQKPVKSVLTPQPPLQ